MYRRLFNQCQYQKENIKNGSADHIRQERLANQHQYQNEKNVYSATIADEVRKFHATVQNDDRLVDVHYSDIRESKSSKFQQTE